MGFGSSVWPEWAVQIAQAVAGVNGKRYADLERELDEARYELDLAQDEIAEMRSQVEQLRRGGNASETASKSRPTDPT